MAKSKVQPLHADAPASSITLREEFARSAMLGILANSSIGYHHATDSAAQLACQMADALLLQLAKRVQIQEPK